MLSSLTFLDPPTLQAGPDSLLPAAEAPLESFLLPEGGDVRAMQHARLCVTPAHSSLAPALPR